MRGNNQLFLSGLGVDTLTGNIVNFQTLIKTDTGTWTVNGIPVDVQSAEVAGGTLILTGDNSTYTGQMLVDAAGTLQARAQSLPAAITDNGLVRFAQTDDGTYAGLLSGTGSIEKTGAGTLFLAPTATGGNTYSGGTLITQGTLNIAADNALGGTAGGVTFKRRHAATEQRPRPRRDPRHLDRCEWRDDRHAAIFVHALTSGDRYRLVDQARQRLAHDERRERLRRHERAGGYPCSRRRTAQFGKHRHGHDDRRGRRHAWRFRYRIRLRDELGHDRGGECLAGFFCIDDRHLLRSTAISPITPRSTWRLHRARRATLLNVSGNYVGNNAQLIVNTVMNAGGAPSNQFTDQLVIGGNASGSTTVTVRPSGLGALTVGDGIKLVQVNGSAAASTFHMLAPVQAGAYQYLLYQGGSGAP